MHDLRFLSAFLFLLEIAGCIHNLHQPPSVSLLSTPSPFFFSSLHLPFFLLAIWLLQLCSLAYCRMCRCHQKLFTFQHFDAVSHEYKLQCWRLLFFLQTKADGRGLLFAPVCWDHNEFDVPSHLHSPQLHHASRQSKVIDTVRKTMECFLSGEV